MGKKANLIKYASIEQYRSALFDMRKQFEYGKHGDTLTFEGTVKLHGTNAGVVFEPDGEIRFQSRNRTLSLESDNLTFAFSMHQIMDYWKRVQAVLAPLYPGREIVVYGEWCGEGIQDRVAISELPKMFVIFDVKIVMEPEEANYYVPFHSLFEEHGLWNNDIVHSIYEAPTYSVEVSCVRPDNAIPYLNEITGQVEDECPFAKTFDVSGVGEGVVWKNHEFGYRFKTKGEKHSKSKVAKKPQVQLTPEQYETREQFVKAVLTEERLKQGADYLTEMGYDHTMRSFSHYLKWMMGDIFKEEQDLMLANGIDGKMLGKFLPNMIRIEYEKRYAGI